MLRTGCVHQLVTLHFLPLQAGMHFHDFGLDLKNPDFVKYAKAYGACGYRITKPEEFNPTLEHCLRTKAVHVVEVPIDYSMSDHLQVMQHHGTQNKACMHSTACLPRPYHRRNA